MFWTVKFPSISFAMTCKRMKFVQRSVFKTDTEIRHLSPHYHIKKSIWQNHSPGTIDHEQVLRRVRNNSEIGYQKIYAFSWRGSIRTLRILYV